METKFRVGDLIKVVNKDKMYPNYDEWITRNANKYAVFFAYDCYDINTDDTYKVVAVAPHRRSKRILYLIQSHDNRCYLLEESGIESVLKETEGIRIIIDTDGETTTARLFNSQKGLTRTSEVKCHPSGSLTSDEFSFEASAKLAIGRLFFKEENTSKSFPQESQNRAFWILISRGSDLTYECSNCGREAVYHIGSDNRYHFENFCPHCGRIMTNAERV